MLIDFSKEEAGTLNVMIPVSMEQFDGIKDAKERAQRIAHTSPSFVTIIPGVNEISKKIWNAIRNDSLIKDYRERSWLKVLNADENVKIKGADGVEKEKDVEKAGYEDLKVEEQEVIIEKVFSLKLLRSLKKQTKEGAMASMNSRIEFIKNPHKATDDDDDDDE